MNRLFFVLLAVFSSFYCLQCGDSDGTAVKKPVEIDAPFVTDELGRAIIFKGANIDRGAKGGHVPDITREQVLRISRDWGFNFVRYLLVWEAVEPSAEQYDYEYLAKVKTQLDWFAEAGIYVMLDMHQDVYAKKFCCDGAPEWAIWDDGLSFELQNQWWTNYLQPAVKRAFDNFWDYQGKNAYLQDRFAAMWGEVVKTLKDSKAVIAYDIMNEPHPGSDFDPAEAVGIENPEGPSPGFDRDKLQPFYQRVINKIRQIDADKWIAFEGRYGAVGNGMPCYFTKLNDPRNGRARLLYAPHMYSVALEAKLSYDPTGDTSVADWAKNRKKEAGEWGMPLIAGEWGLDLSWTNSRLFMRDVLNALESLNAGWAYWSWDPGGWSWLDPQEKETDAANSLVRVYARKIAGIPKSFKYDTETKVFTLKYDDDTKINGPTEIYVPAKRFFSAGFSTEVDGAAEGFEYKWDAETEILLLTVKNTGGTHTVKISPKI